MTLCLAWRNNNEYFFASDSRLTTPSKVVTSDEATKVFKIDVELYGSTPHDQPHKEPELIQSTKYGLCFAGSYSNGSLLADAISEVLSNIQIVPGYSDVSIDNLSNIAFAVFKQVSKHLMAMNRQFGLSSVLFGGYCLETGNFKLYKFHPSEYKEGEQLDFQRHEIELAAEPVFIGDEDAIAKAKGILAKAIPGHTYFHLLRDIIKDSEIETVGGKIQCGHFTSGTFRTNGIIEYSLEYNDDSSIPYVKSNFNYRGLSLDLDDTELRTGDINIMKTFFDPFHAEMHSLFKDVEEAIERHVEKQFQPDPKIKK